MSYGRLRKAIIGGAVIGGAVTAGYALSGKSTNKTSQVKLLFVLHAKACCTKYNVGLYGKTLSLEPYY